jgi:hypothetical protein
MYGTWPFPLPSELYRQLRQFDLRSPEAVEILMTIKELVHLYNVTYDFPHEFGQRKARKLSFYMRFFLRQKAIADDLKAVVRKINADEELTDMYGNMPVPDQKSARLRH